jgi:CMP/dCMP kinase
MPQPSIIAIDGPAASGKSTLGRNLARDLGYLFFDTGVMYRAVTWAAIPTHIPFSDEQKITDLAERIEIEILPPSLSDGRDSDILVDRQDITWEIRTTEVERNVSQVSAYPGVRQALGMKQRRIGLRGRVVMVGRDIGTVIMPEAGLKVFLTASPEERARRRYQEIFLRGSEQSYEAILADIIRRDGIDSTRSMSPLKPADDAVILDTDKLNISEVLQIVHQLIKKLTDADTQSSGIRYEQDNL